MTSEIQLCHFGSQQGSVQVSSQCLYKTLGFLSGGPLHSSNSNNAEAQLSMGWSGLNFTAGRMRVCDCSGLLHYPVHAYSVAGPWATTEGERASAPCPKPNPRLFTYFFLFTLSPLSSFSFVHSLHLCVSLPLTHLSQPWREQRRLISAAGVKRETRAWSQGLGSL